MHDESAISVHDCDPKGPLILYISDDYYGFDLVLVFPDSLALHVCYVCLYYSECGTKTIVFVALAFQIQHEHNTWSILMGPDAGIDDEEELEMARGDKESSYEVIEHCSHRSFFIPTYQLCSMFLMALSQPIHLSPSAI